MTFFALTGLMIATVLASFKHIGPADTDVYNNLLAMFIAIVKATLVVLFFMHGKYSTTLTKLWILIGFSWFPLMSLILMDYGVRRFEALPSWSPQSESALPRNLDRDMNLDEEHKVNIHQRIGARGN